MKKFILVLFTLLSLIGYSHAAIVNGSFEDGLNGFYAAYNRNGEYYVYQTLGNGIINPTDGNNFLYISTGPGDVYSDEIDDSQIILSDEFTVESGIQTLSFDFNILTEQDTPSNFFNDRASVSLENPSETIVTCSTDSNRVTYRNDLISFGNTEIINDAFKPLPSEITTQTGAHYTKQTGWYTAIIDVSELAGLTITPYLNINVSEMSGSELWDTALLIDNIRLNPASIPTNQPPNSDCGDDIVVFDEVTLDGSASSDPEGSELTYYWTLNHKTNPDISIDATGVNPTISGLVNGFYVLCLTGY